MILLTITLDLDGIPTLGRQLHLLIGSTTMEPQLTAKTPQSTIHLPCSKTVAKPQWLVTTHM